MRLAKHQTLGASAVLACALFCGATTASAGVLETDLNLDAYFDGSTTWRGTTSYQGYNGPPENLVESDMHGTIDWAVFAPGAFALEGFSDYVPTPGEFVYTYQVIQDGDASAPLSALSVVLGAAANNIGTFTGNGVAGVATSGPTPQFFIGSPYPSANWDFALGTIPAGQTSVGLVFSSPFGPQLLSGSVIDDGSVGEVVPLPSPAPEPSTLLFWSCGIAFCAARWLKGRKTKS